MFASMVSLLALATTGITGDVVDATTPTREPLAAAPALQPFLGDVLPPLTKQGSALDGGTVTAAMEQEPSSLDGQLDPVSPWGRRIARLMLESLGQYDNATATLRPRLARTWTLSPDGTRVLFELRTDVQWHDGKPMTAD